jgi:hypothetical protein
LGEAAVNLERPRDPEVRHLGPAVAVQEHVLRLDVAVHDPVLVSEAQRPGHLEHDLDRLPLR